MVLSQPENAGWDGFLSAPQTWAPEESQWGLPLLYLVFALDVVILYFACRQYIRYKFSHPDSRLLKYL